MWETLRNFVSNLQAYPFLSPDLAVRRQVNQRLRSRPCLNAEEWFIQLWTPPAVAAPLPQPLISFVHERLAEYSGLDMGRVRPSDNLTDALQFPQVCWFDWGLNLCEDFESTFGIDITDTFDEMALETLTDLVNYLYEQLNQDSTPS